MERIEQTVMVYMEERFSGPLPPPRLLRQYDETVPGAAERIIALAEKQSAHRQDLESRVVKSDVRSQSIGQWMAFTLGAGGVFGGLYLVAQGFQVSGLAALFTALAALVGVFFLAKRGQQKALEAKREASS